MIPEKYKDVDYDKDVPESIKSILRQMKETGKGLYIHGGVGTGKTHMAYAILKKFNEIHRHGGLFFNTTELLRDIKDDFDRPYADKNKLCERLMESKSVVFLDDIGAEKASDFVQETFYMLINKKYNDNVPMIFTSNKSIKELADHIGERIASRLVEMCYVYHLNGEDKRMAHIEKVI